MPETTKINNQETENTKKVKIEGIVGGIRLSTQQLLQEIYKKLEEGYTEFEILGSGQHDIGGPLWRNDNKPLIFKVKNPGQRVGSMGMLGTQIIIEGSAPADVGWLNAGAEIILKGDGGDTTAHCAANGKIYVGGRVGTRSGALMKHDPKFPAPEFWVLKNAGSFSFEFMGGGVAVVCGYGCETLDSVLGHRSCVGMVGGTVYVRGKVQDLSDDVWLMDLNDGDIEFLSKGLPEFLGKVEKPEILPELLEFSQWKKIVAKTYEERNIRSLMPTKQFRQTKWVEGGIFGDIIEEDYYVAELVETNRLRIRYPEWRNSNYSAPCEYNCPIGIPTQKRIALLRDGNIAEALRLVLDYSPFPASVCGQVCPNLCIDECNRKYIDVPVKTAELGLLSKDIKIEAPKKEQDKKVAVIGSGAAGIGAAWHLRRLGYQVELFEEDKVIGGKLRQVIPEERLNREILNTELERIKNIGVKIKTNSKMDQVLFGELEKNYDAVVVAVGAHKPVVIPFEGHERLIKGLDFLKAINNGEKPKVGNKVVVIGAGNAAMDVVIGAYQLGAKEVTSIDIQKPAAFQQEIEHVEKLGAKILWPCFTDKVSEKGVHLKDGTLLEADTVIISVGDRPDLAFLSTEYMDETGRARINEFMQSEANEKVFIPGDAVKLGLFTNAIADGRKVALNIDRMLSVLPLDNFEKAPMIPKDRVKTEFYQPIHPQSVSKMDTEEEANRCMSCGFCRDCKFCQDVCPEQAITRREYPDKSFEYYSDPEKCIGCGICAGVCPCGVWTMLDNLSTYEEA
ncbi:MAG: 4Fe-4S ferredoxin [Candidatus Melainabacteria bacterium RIFOXYA12_FULL_32_12]|nr:MAG: 4Fe-4S ferredoxin [Candidatus Melainabacteria bacterium RIFOXYA2_FULL_32_9]OGI30462.1 MAG: 4Fe-4S ferredoxin [Candidatus Melainabacteria bacterium RIFOXYA12_FULL_32_12]